MPVHASTRPPTCQPGPDYATHGPTTPYRHEVTCPTCLESLTTPRQMGDRRQGPRRAHEAALHYAEVSLHAAAVAWADTRARRHTGEPGTFPDLGEATRALESAVETYRAAYLRTDETTPTPPPG